MTTIAYHHKDKQVAIDSRITQGDLIVTDKAVKVIKSELGTFLISGARCDYEEFVKLKKGDTVDPAPECSAFLIRDGELFEVYVNQGRMREDKLMENNAAGSGRDQALAAMDHGKNAKEAVEYAITRDIYSGGEVRVFDVSEGVETNE